MNRRKFFGGALAMLSAISALLGLKWIARPKPIQQREDDGFELAGSNRFTIEKNHEYLDNPWFDGIDSELVGLTRRWEHPDGRVRVNTSYWFTRNKD